MSTNVKQTVNFKINGKDASATEDTVIIEAAKQHGIEITNLCYNRKLKPFAACRTCMVDMRTPEGKKELVYSCTQPVADILSRDGVAGTGAVRTPLHLHVFIG